MKGTIVMSKNTQVETGVAVLEHGFALLEPRAWATKKKEGEEAAKADAPKFSAGVDFDKKTQADQIKKLLAAQEAAVEVLREKGEWDDDLPGKFPLYDADTKKVQASATDKRKVILSEKKPQLAGRYVLSTKSKEDKRPDVRYLALKRGANGAMIPVAMPMPLLEPGMTDEQVNEVKAIWNKHVYPGQNVNLGVTFRAWTMPDSQGVQARLDSVTIVGGGKRLDTVPFESHFGEEKLDEMMEWLNANTNFQLPTVEDGGADATVDVQTGEVSGPDDTAAPVEFGVQLGEPSKKTHRRKAEPKQGDEFSDGFGDDMPL